MHILTMLLDGLKSVCAGLPDARRGDRVIYSMQDAGMAGFAPFFMQSESFLSHQRQLEQGHGRSNCQSLFGMSKIPTDNHIRNLLDPVPPSAFQPCFDQALLMLKTKGCLSSFQRLDGRVLVALDGTEYFCSQKLQCPACQTRKRNNGAVESYHSMLCATIVAPGHTHTVPLMPEFITPQDGHEKQDCELVAAKRWLAVHHAQIADLKPIYLGDDLFSHQPLAAEIRARDGDFLFVCKPQAHKSLMDFITGATANTHVVVEKKHGKQLTYHYKWINAVPLRDSRDALEVNWFSLTITDPKGKVTYRNDFATSLLITKNNIHEMAACGRARWKIENESFNVLKNNGYHLEHNFGHGKQWLAMVFATLNLLAFAFHTVCDLLEDIWKNAREKRGSRRRFFESIRVLTEYFVFNSWVFLFHKLSHAEKKT